MRARRKEREKSEWMNERDWMNEWMKERLNEWMNEWKNKDVNVWMKE